MRICSQCLVLSPVSLSLSQQKTLRCALSLVLPSQWNGRTGMSGRWSRNCWLYSWSWYDNMLPVVLPLRALPFSRVLVTAALSFCVLGARSECSLSGVSVLPARSFCVDVHLFWRALLSLERLNRVPCIPLVSGTSELPESISRPERGEWGKI